MANLSTIKEENNKPTKAEQKKMKALLKKKGVKTAKLKEVFGMSEKEFLKLTGGKKPGDIKNYSGNWTKKV